MIDVSQSATGGSGTAANPWTGWDTAISWTADTTYYFPKGVYAYSASPNFALSGIRLIGENATLKFTGTGNCVEFLGPTGAAFNIEMSGFLIQGTSSATNGLFLRSIGHSRFSRIRVTDVSADAFLTNGVVGILFDTPICSVNEGTFAVTPVNGMVFDKRAPSTPSTTVTVLNPVMEGVSGAGLHVKQAHDIRVHGGVSEANGRGLIVDEFTGAFPVSNVFSLDLEANTTEDALIKGPKNTFIQCSSTTTFHISTGTGNDNVILGGGLWNVTIDNGALRNRFCDLNISGTLTDNGVDTSFDRVLLEATGKWYPNTVHGRLLAKGPAPALSGAIGLGTGSAAMDAASTDFVGVVVLSPNGTPWSGGQFTVTLNSAQLGSRPS